MKKKMQTQKEPRKNSEQVDSVKFCLNCDDMDDLATSPEVNDLKGVKDRFHNCDKAGRFEGDFCSRIFVADPGEELGPIFDED